MVFYVVEIQTLQNSGSVIPFTFVNRNEAEQKYHETLKYAAVSEVPYHGAIMFNQDGFVLKTEVYNHTEHETEN